jgi:dolichol-phosphate mannosyltransferase
VLNLIVVVWNDRQNISYLYERAQPVLDQLAGVQWSVVFVNNASDDGSLDELRRLRLADPRVKILTLARNFGYHAALIAGLSQVEGDLYAIVDVDCEDPPELLADFYRSISEGAQLAYGIRSNRDEPWLLTLGRRLFYIINALVADSAVVMWMGEFAMFTKQVRDAALAPRTTFPFLRTELAYVGFPRVGLPYRRARRRHGKSHYNLWTMSQFAVGGILAGTTFPLRLVLFIAIAFGVGLPVIAFVLRLDINQTASLAIVAMFYFVLFSVSTIALYLARTYRNGVARPIFVVDAARTML